MLPEDRKASDIGYSTLGLWVQDFDQTLQRLAIMGTELLTEPMGSIGERRVCVYDPEGVLIEIFEQNPVADFLPDTNLNSCAPRPEVPVCAVSTTLSVHSSEDSLTYFRDILSLSQGQGRLHKAEHESLW